MVELSKIEELAIDIYLVVDDEDEVILNYNKLYDVKIKKQEDLK